MGVSIDDDELWDFVSGAHTGVLTTLRRDGWPVPLPTWFVVLDRAVHMRTPAHARKVARIRADGRAGFVVESGNAWTELRAVVLLGRAEVVDGPALKAAVGAAMAAKYAGVEPPSTVPAATRRLYRAGNVLVRFVPTEGVLSWDNSSIRLHSANSADRETPTHG